MTKQRTMNMFAETNEDLPIISGFALTQAAEFPEALTPKQMYDLAVNEVKAEGFSIKQSSWYGEAMVVVTSCSPYLGYREIVATFNGKLWDITRVYRQP